MAVLNDEDAGLFSRYRERAESLGRRDARVALTELRRRSIQARKSGDNARTASTLVCIAMVLRGQRRHAEAIRVLEDARALLPETADSRILAAVYHELSISHREFHRNALALEYAHQAVVLLQALERTTELGWAYDNLAVIYFNRGQRHESLTYAERARAVFQETGSSYGQAWNACNLANLLFEAGQLTQAARLYAEAERLFIRLKSPQGCAWTLFRLSFVHRARCDFALAERTLLRARSLFEKLGLRDRVGWCLLIIAAIKRAQGDQSEAVTLNKKVIRLHGPLKIHDGVAWAHFQIGQIHRERGEHTKAWQTLRRALNLHTDISNRLGMGWAENEIGRVYQDLDDEAHARDRFAKALAHAEALGCEPLIAETCRHLASLALDRAELQKATELLGRARAAATATMSREAQAEIKFIEARHWILLGDDEQAAKEIEEARALVDTHRLTRLKPALEILLGETAMANGRTSIAARHWRIAAGTAERLGQCRQRAESALGLAQTADQGASGLVRVEREVIATTSRRLKAKLLLLRALVTLRSDQRVDERLFELARHNAREAGHIALAKLIGDVLSLATHGSLPPVDPSRNRRDRAADSSDLALIRLNAGRPGTFPVSVVA